MAINPNISLQARPPQTAGPMEQYGQMLSLRNLMQQNQTGKIRNLMMQQEIDEQPIIMDAYAQSKGDLFQTLKKAATSGKVRPETLMGLHAAAVKQAEDEARLTKQELEINASKSSRLADLVDSITDDNTKQVAVQQAMAEGLIDPQKSQELLSTPFGPEMAQKLKTLTTVLRPTAVRLKMAADAKEEERKGAEEGRKRLLFPQQLAKGAAEANLAALESKQGGKKTLHPVTIKDPKSGNPVPAVQEIMPDGTSRILLGGQEVPNAIIYSRPSATGVVPVTTVDASGKSVTRFVKREEGAEYPAAPTADMRNKEFARGKTTDSVAAIEALSKKVINKRGIAQRAMAAGRSVESALGNDPEYRTYQDARMALAGNLAVLQQGSRPSDIDIKAIWLPLVPDVFRDTDESAAMKWNLIKTMSGLPTAEKPDETLDTLKAILEKLNKVK